MNVSRRRRLEIGEMIFVTVIDEALDSSINGAYTVVAERFGSPFQTDTIPLVEALPRT